MRDVIQANGLVIAADNSGSVGRKKQDAVSASYETVGYFSARVALMECVAAGGEPFTAVIQNFSGDEAWMPLCRGIEKAAFEMGCLLELTGSTESNFKMNQSATGIVVIGRHVRNTNQFEQGSLRFGVIGEPLVGAEVLMHAEKIAPLSVFKQIVEMKGIKSVIPVGSKGLRHELRNFGRENGQCELDLDKSAGPSTCFLFAAEEEAAKKIGQTVEHVYWVT